MNQKLEIAAECPSPDEQLHIDSLIEHLRRKMSSDYTSGRTLRDAHPKMHGCVRADFLVESSLSPNLGIGVFSLGSLLKPEQHDRARFEQRHSRRGDQTHGS